MTVWGLAAAGDGRVLLRIEDHDRTRSREIHAQGIIDDLDWLGFAPDLGPIRQSDDDRPYREALDRLRSDGRIYACDCTRSTFARFAAVGGLPWSGPGCPGGCRSRPVDARGATLRAWVGDGLESWVDRFAGPASGPVADHGDPVVRDRAGGWTYGFAVVVDDLRQGIDLVVRGEDLLAATPDQIRLGALLGRDQPATFAHHRLIRRADGRKLSKSAGDMGVRELRAAGWSAAQVIGEAAAAIGLLEGPRPLAAHEVGALFG